MSGETKKISFGFSKFVKKTQIVPSQANQVKPDKVKFELIDCFEDKNLKLKDHVESEDRVLVIPLQRKKEISTVVDSQSSVSESSRPISNDLPASKNSIDNDQKEVENLSSKPNLDLGNVNGSSIASTNLAPTQLTLDEIAAKEILEDLKSKKTQEEHQVFSVPLTNNPPAGEKESSLEDYENIPVSDFGLAMLRGMGWAPGKGIGKSEKLVAPALPTLRPKGMGLGADKVIKTEITGTGTKTSKTGTDDLKMVKGSFVRLIAGPHKDCYGQIEGFDDEGGRLIVKLALKNVSLSLNEFMVQLVDKSDFTKNSKVINVAKYEQYKDNQSKKISDLPQSGKPRKGHNEYHSLENKLNDTRREQIIGSRTESRSPENKVLFEDKHSRSKDEYSSKEFGERSRHRYSTRHSSSSESEPSRKSKDFHHGKKKSRHERSSSEDSSKRDRYGNLLQSARSSTKSSKKSSRKESRNKSNKAIKSRSSSCSSNSSSVSSDYSRKFKKKKSSYHKHKSRSRSRSPRRHNLSKRHK